MESILIFGESLRTGSRESRNESRYSVEETIPREIKHGNGMYNKCLILNAVNRPTAWRWRRFGKSGEVVGGFKVPTDSQSNVSLSCTSMDRMRRV